MLVARAVNMTSNLLVISLLARRLTKDSFGLWSVLSSFVIFSGGFDLGLGQGLKNKLASLSATSSVETIKEERDYYFSVLYILFFVASCGILAGIVFCHFINWPYLLNIQDQKINAIIAPLMATIIAFLFINLPLSLNISGFLAYQESHLRGILDILQSLLLLLVISITTYLFSFPTIIISYYFSFTLSAIIATIFFLKRRKWSIIWLPIKYQINKVKPIFGISIHFWFLGLSAILIFATDPIIVSRVAGLAETGDFSVIQKLFTLLIAIHFTILTPLWSAYTQAAEGNDWKWIIKSLYNSIFITLALFSVGGLCIILIYKFIFKIWIGKDIENTRLVMAMAFWALMYSWINCFSVFLNGINKIRFQTYLIITSAILNIPISLMLGYRYGSIGVTIGSILSILPLAISNPIQTFKIIKNKV